MFHVSNFSIFFLMHKKPGSKINLKKKDNSQTKVNFKKKVLSDQNININGKLNTTEKNRR